MANIPLHLGHIFHILAQEIRKGSDDTVDDNLPGAVSEAGSSDNVIPARECTGDRDTFSNFEEGMTGFGGHRG